MDTNSSSSFSQKRTRASDEKRNAYLRRFQLLRHQQLARLCDVMETDVPIHGTGNFPTLDIKPSRLVQLVRDRLVSIGIKVCDIRLNGSAATHVLSDDVTHTYKDLDLIFAIDFPHHPHSDAVPSRPEASTFELSDSQQEKKEDLDDALVNGRSPMLRPTNLPTAFRSRSPQHSSEKDIGDDNSSVDDSGYTSGGSSVTSLPPSPCSLTPIIAAKKRKRFYRSRTRSLESTSSTSSMTTPTFKSQSDDVAVHRQMDSFTRDNWQGIKDATMDLLVEFLPPLVNRTNMSSIVLGNAYVQKMVKVTTETDKWSLISLNNNSGRNLELKFVQSMKRQYEFSVDSFQIILDTYLAYNQAVMESNSAIQTSERFFPTVLAESVYGDFAAALRHLRRRRICTHRPEEIRGGGLLRYCNLLVRDFSPGDDDDQNKRTSTSTDAVTRLEQHMCSRFFIDFSDIELQQKKLLGYLDSHFLGEEELKFQYLLVLRKVVGTSTICLMHHERSMILDAITALARQSLANILGKSLPQSPSPYVPGYFMPGREQFELEADIDPNPARQFEGGNGPSPSSSAFKNPPFIRCYSPSNTPYSRPSTPSVGASGPNNTGESVCTEDESTKTRLFVQQSYCCPCCSQYFHSSFYCYSTPSYLPNAKAENYPVMVQPIYYHPSKMTCIYQPAGYTSKPAEA